MSTESIIKKAMELGSAIALSEQVFTLKDAQTRVMEDPETSSLLGNFQELRSQMENKMQDGLQIVPAEEEKLESLQQQLNELPLIKELIEAQGHYNNLMESVFFVINQAVSGEECGADCSACGGSCAH